MDITVAPSLRFFYIVIEPPLLRRSPNVRKSLSGRPPPCLLLNLQKRKGTVYSLKWNLKSENNIINTQKVACNCCTRTPWLEQGHHVGGWGEGAENMLHPPPKILEACTHKNTNTVCVCVCVIPPGCRIDNVSI